MEVELAARRLGVIDDWVDTLTTLFEQCVRHASDTPEVGHSQSVRATLADMRIQIEVCRRLAQRAGRRDHEVARATLLVSQSARWVTQHAIDILGPDAIDAGGLPALAYQKVHSIGQLAGRDDELRSEIAISIYRDRGPADPLLDNEEQAFLDHFARVCRERIAPRASDADRTGMLPEQNWSDLVDAGYLRLFHPPELGGTGASGALQAQAMETLGKACASTLWTATISTALAGKMIHNLCQPRHHAGWLRPIVMGERIGCFAATEDASSCDPGSFMTSVSPTGRGYRLTGVKSRISNALTADVAIVLARLGPDLCYVVVDLHQDGVRRVAHESMGLSALSWGRLIFDNVEVAADDVIAGADMDTVMHTVQWGHLLQIFCAIGIADAAFEAATTYAAERHAFGRPIAHLQVVHTRLAQMWSELDAARLLAAEAAERVSQGRDARELVMMAKIYATEMAVRTADGALRTFGGWGYSRGHVVERLYRDSLANIPAGLPTDRLRELLAGPMVGVDPWRYEPFEGLSV